MATMMHLERNVLVLFDALAMAGGTAEEVSTPVRCRDGFKERGLWLEVAGSSPDVVLSIEGSTQEATGTYAPVKDLLSSSWSLNVVAAGIQALNLPNFFMPLIRIRCKANVGNGADTVVTVHLHTPEYRVDY
jgi:hypothetical protein